MTKYSNDTLYQDVKTDISDVGRLVPLNDGVGHGLLAVAYALAAAGTHDRLCYRGKTMSGYTEHYREMQQAHFIDKWVPERASLQKKDVDPENYIYVLAKLRAAESELRTLKDALRVLKNT
jgi:hypothetical protein